MSEVSYIAGISAWNRFSDALFGSNHSNMQKPSVGVETKKAVAI